MSKQHFVEANQQEKATVTPKIEINPFVDPTTSEANVGRIKGKL